MAPPLLARSVSALLTLAVGGLVWFFLAPPVLGGSTTYVVTHGISMEPRFHTGDLALVRPAGSYRVGDVVAFRSRSLNTVVLHRIVAIDGGRYIFKGDNNNFEDPEHPARGQLVGKLWLHIPHAGQELRLLREPVWIGALAGLAALLLVGGNAGFRRRRQRGRAPAGAPPTRTPRPVGAANLAAPALAGAALLACLLLVAIAYSRGTEVSDTSSVPYAQRGSFSYSATAPAGVVYPDGRVATGQPLFATLVDVVKLRFAYQLESRLPQNLTVVSSFEATIASSQGWQRPIHVQPVISLRRSDGIVDGTLRLRALERLLRRVEAESATTRGATYTLTIHPQIKVSGTLGDTPISDHFSPTIPFTLDPVQLRPSLPGNTTTGPAHGATPITFTSSGAVTLPVRAPATLAVRGLKVTVARARVVALAGTGIAFAVLLAVLIFASRRRPVDEVALIERRYRHLLIPVSPSDRTSYDRVVEVKTMQALAQIAQRYNRMILHEENTLGHSYAVADDRLLYVYLVGQNIGGKPPVSAAGESAHREQTRH
jgi:signal peptidase I